MRTISQLVDTHGVDVDPHLERDALVPVSAGLQRQGDVIVIPAAIVRAGSEATTLVPRDGVPVVRGEAGGNTHLLLADGPVRWDTAPRDLTLGVLTVEAGAVAFEEFLAGDNHREDGLVAGIGAQPPADQPGEGVDLEVQRGDQPLQRVDTRSRLDRQPRVRSAFVTVDHIHR